MELIFDVEYLLWSFLIIEYSFFRHFHLLKLILGETVLGWKNVKNYVDFQKAIKTMLLSKLMNFKNTVKNFDFQKHSKSQFLKTVKKFMTFF